MSPKLKAIKMNSGLTKEDIYMRNFYPEYDQMCPVNLNRYDVDRIVRDETTRLDQPKLDQ